MFDPIKAAKEIKNSYIDYITTTFDFADDDYKKALRQELEREGMVAKGPFLDIGGSYQTGHTLTELVEAKKASPLFLDLEPVPEQERELKLERPLYLHQEEALLKAQAGENIVVTTGTGSGKTESFFLPIIDHLLKEQEEGALSDGVRAIIIYPMNALANDQMKRMRALFKNYPQICYGVYNGNTRHTQSEALAEYRRTYRNATGEPIDPAPNEIISREMMQRKPPHILITNYSMLEYMMLRPKDDAVFSGAKLKFIVLDEAHIYKGATGIETSLLMRRLRARISEPDGVQYILTSATLGGADADGQILDFAEKLCGVPFSSAGIIRSQERKPKMEELLDLPAELFEKLGEGQNITDILAQYHADFAPMGTEEEKLYALFLHSRLFAALREAAKGPITISQLRHALREVCPMTDEQMVSFISVYARAEKDGASLIKPRYHFFVRALEGAYVTLSSPKRLFLRRKHSIQNSADEEPSAAVFEVAVCTDCGTMAIVGCEKKGLLHHHARKGIQDHAEFYYLKKSKDGTPIQEDGAETEDDGTNDFIVCDICGAIATEADTRFQPLCRHDASHRHSLRKVELNKDRIAKCPACGFGSFRRFYLGSEAATAVLATELFEQLPDEDVIIQQETDAGNSARRSIFSGASQIRKVKKERMRQFLCFSDSRSEAAFFASYMERSYGEFLRRRGIWHIAEKYRRKGIWKVPVYEFVEELKRHFENERSFAHWGDGEDQEMGKLAADSRSNAWVAVLNEMYNARRSTSLVSMGRIFFAYQKNEAVADTFHKAPYHLPEEDARALLELLTQDAIFSGAVDAGKEQNLSAAEREYIFFTPTARKLVKQRIGETSKQSWTSGWCGRKRANGRYYPNSRISRLAQALNISDEDADGILEGYWDDVFAPETEEFSLDANDFYVCIGGTPEAWFYRCQKCGRITPYSVNDRCASVKCGGTLVPCDPLAGSEGNHYARLCSSRHFRPLYIKEHTAQLAKDQQTKYQEAFAQKKINALSCSTTFEMGVDVGSLETVYMRDVPPSPSNYVQRAGRAGRGKRSVAFVMIYAKLSSHDFTYYDEPERLISGNIKAPVFEIENEKILDRHIFAVAFSAFLARHSEVYAGDDQTVLLNEGGYERLKEYLSEQPEDLRQLLLRSIPQKVHQRLGIQDFGWIQRLCGENGVLEMAVQDFRGTVAEMEKERQTCRRLHDDEEAGKWSRAIKAFRCGKDDNAGKKSLIGFLVRNNVLPKYGFPVDTVELIPNIDAMGSQKSLQLARDLQMAVAEYAPGAQVVADGRMYVSRYIRKMPGKNANPAWEKGFYCPRCPECGQPNFTKEPLSATGRECVSCHTPIKRISWKKTLEPRMGFCAEKEAREVPMHRPERDRKTDDHYIGDPHRHLIARQRFEVNGQVLQIESTSNDSLVVIGQTNYKVCPACGYAVESEKDFPAHKNARDHPCINKEGKFTEYRLSHDFKTDVAKITFVTQEAGDINVMLSVLYALLEGLSRELGIERTDIKGCLFYTDAENCMVYSLVLYDAVPGGAGHVRRIVTEDGEVFQKVLEKAIFVVDNCDCDSSCYRCLRNYYNQKIHDLLGRKEAAAFLRQWRGDMRLLPSEEDLCTP